MKSGLELKHDEVMKKLGKTSGTLTDNDVRLFLRERSKSRYTDEFIAAVTIINEREQTTEGVRVVCATPPIEKFRVILPLKEPVRIIDLDPCTSGSQALENKVTGFAVKDLGHPLRHRLHRPSRLFFTPRHPEGAPFRSTIIQGKPLDFETIPSFSKEQYCVRAPQLRSRATPSSTPAARTRPAADAAVPHAPRPLAQRLGPQDAQPVPDRRRDQAERLRQGPRRRRRGRGQGPHRVPLRARALDRRRHGDLAVNPAASSTTCSPCSASATPAAAGIAWSSWRGC
jgi:hypothetical protein